MTEIQVHSGLFLCFKNIAYENQLNFLYLMHHNWLYESKLSQ